MFSWKRIIDISLPLDGKTVIYPGNPPVEITTVKSSSGTSFHSEISFGSHTATHLDAPRHVFEKGIGIDEINLDNFIGDCRVLDFSGSEKGGIETADLEKKNIKKGERILLKTNNSERGFTRFYDDFFYLTGEGAIYLAGKGVKLVGIDYLSIKKRGGADNTAHTALLSQNIPILEGIDLKEVREGKYFVVALPLKFIGLDGSPVRAVLLEY